ncbi:MAG: single-stranded DNA-binding protein [Sarcina sp.]
MNKVIVLATLTKDLELRYSQSANPVAVAKGGIAVRRKFAKQGEQDVDFFNITAFGKTAENMSKFFKKGSPLLIEGHLQQNTWKDQEGNNKSSVDIVVDSFDFTRGDKQESVVTATTQQEDESDLPF